jgi:hypothetical protein
VVERSTDGVNFSGLASLGAGVTAYSDLAVSGGFTYTYRVAAFNATGTSAWSDPVPSASVPSDATAPAAPSNLSVVVGSVTRTTLTLAWQDNSNNETGFTIQRATNSGFTSNVVNVNVGPDVTSLNVTGLARRTTYYFRVLAFNGFNGGAGPFPWSPTLNVTTSK